MNRYRLRIIALTALVCLAGSSCTDDENGGQGNNIVYGENIIGNGEQTFEIKDHQYLKRGTYLMKGWCYVTYGSTLTIEAGTVIKGDKETRAALIIEPGGKLIAQGTVDAPIGRSPADRKKMAVEPKNGKRAVTHYKVLSHLNHQFNHIECQLETGRTHQIRVHMASIRHPLLGDTTYGPKNAMGLTGQCLHARVLGFIHPRTGEYVEFEAPLPEYFQKLLEKYS